MTRLFGIEERIEHQLRGAGPVYRYLARVNFIAFSNNRCVKLVAILYVGRITESYKNPHDSVATRFSEYPYR